jgi:hypothetical protein
METRQSCEHGNRSHDVSAKGRNLYLFTYLIIYLLTYSLTYLLTHSLYGAEAFLRN